MLCCLEPLAQHVVCVIVHLRLAMPLLAVEPDPSAADGALIQFALVLAGSSTRLFGLLFHYADGLYMYALVLVYTC